MKNILPFLCLFLAAALSATASTVTLGEVGDVRIVVFNKDFIASYVDVSQIADLDRIQWPRAKNQKLIVVTARRFYDRIGDQDLIEVVFRAWSGEEMCFKKHCFFNPKDSKPEQKIAPKRKPDKNEKIIPLARYSEWKVS